MKNLLIICFLSFNSFSQGITGVDVITYSLPTFVRVEGAKNDTGKEITRLEKYTLNDSTVAINLYWKSCAGFTYPYPFDTLIDLEFVHPMPFNLQICCYQDTLSGGEPQCISNDSMFLLGCFYYSKEQLFLSTPELNANKIQIYPNPTTEYFTIKSDFGDIKDVKLSDVQGKEVKIQDSGKNSYQASHLPNGMYFLDVKTEIGEIRKKLIINH